MKNLFVKISIVVALLLGGALLWIKYLPPTGDTAPELAPLTLVIDTITITNSGDPLFTIQAQKVTINQTDSAALLIQHSLENLIFSQVVDGDTLQGQMPFKEALEQEHKAMLEIMEPGHTWEIKQGVKVLHSSADFISLALSSYQYLGGAHGNDVRLFVNFRRSTGELLSLRDLIKPEHAVDVASRAEAIFRTQNKLAPTDNLGDAGFWFDNDKFRLPANVGVSQKGLIFYFNAYEIAPYSSGPTQIIIPLEECTPWLALK